jgi:hypothetical protein
MASSAAPQIPLCGRIRGKDAGIKPRTVANLALADRLLGCIDPIHCKLWFRHLGTPKEKLTQILLKIQEELQFGPQKFKFGFGS